MNRENTWAKDITVDELKKVWEPAAKGKIKSWQQVCSNYPDKPLNLFRPGTDSGTFDYFIQVIVGKEDESHSDYTASENDNVLVKGIMNDPNALGYFGYAYFLQNQDRLRALAVNNGEGAVLPSPQTVRKARYQPFSRPLFTYVNMQAAQENPMLRDLIAFYIKNASQIVSDVGYIPLSEQAYHISMVHFYTGKVGTVFKGKSEPNVTTAELLRRQNAF